MKTISSAVEQYIHKKPFLQTALAQGIINMTSLAREIRPEIEDVLGKEAREGAKRPKEKRERIPHPLQPAPHGLPEGGPGPGPLVARQ